MSDGFLVIPAAVIVGAVAGYLGSLLVTKRMALVGDALGHVALPGMALAFTMGFSPTLGAFLSLGVGIIVIWLLGERTHLPTDALVGILFTVSLALAFLLLPGEELEEALIGDITDVSPFEALLAVILATAAFVLARAVFAKVLLIALSADLARAERVKVALMNLLYLGAIGVVVALGVRFAGSLLVGALVVIPAAAVRNVAGSMRQYAWGAAALGAVSAFFAVILANQTGVPAGPLTVILAALAFLLTVIGRKKI